MSAVNLDPFAAVFAGDEGVDVGDGEFVAWLDAAGDGGFVGKAAVNVPGYVGAAVMWEKGVDLGEVEKVFRVGFGVVVVSKVVFKGSGENDGLNGALLGEGALGLPLLVELLTSRIGEVGDGGFEEFGSFLASHYVKDVLVDDKSGRPGHDGLATSDGFGCAETGSPVGDFGFFPSVLLLKLVIDLVEGILVPLQLLKIF